MSLSSTATIKQQLNLQLGTKATTYFECLNRFVTGKISRVEFEDGLKNILDASHLIQLHNTLIISLFDARGFKRPPTPPPDLPKPPPRKRRRTLPYQGPDVHEDTLALRSKRLKRWNISLGKQERERIRKLRDAEPQGSRLRSDEIAQERGVALLPERGDPPGSRLGVQLGSITRAPTLQHIVDRINLICAQNSLGPPSRNVSSLMNLACEVKLKQLITHALTLTSSGLTISSISPSSPGSNYHSTKVLSTSCFETLFEVRPADLPNKSAAAMKLMTISDRYDEDEERNLILLRTREVCDRRWQIVTLLAERSTLREAFCGLRT